MNVHTCVNPGEGTERIAKLLCLRVHAAMLVYENVQIKRLNKYVKLNHIQ